ncbi:hypothetical protein M0R45_030546 [Rubus argutus]|uniref:Uncharacterized protein n=1 Tax=Rubus argutus TaxID=59490 RepID=A0AAW1WF07_RUBAR
MAPPPLCYLLAAAPLVPSPQSSHLHSSAAAAPIRAAPSQYRRCSVQAVLPRRRRCPGEEYAAAQSNPSLLLLKKEGREKEK